MAAPVERSSATETVKAINSPHRVARLESERLAVHVSSRLKLLSERLETSPPAHSAVGCSVTLKCTSRRRPWLSTTSTNSTRKVAVGTVKKSKATRSWAWFAKNARHACDGRPPIPDHIFRNRRLRDRQAQLQQPSMDPWGTPQRIGAAHLPNKIPQFSPNRGPTPSASALPRPVPFESLAVPADHGLRPHHLQRMPLAPPAPRQQNPEDPVGLCQPRPWLTRLPHGEFLP
jgi:hypothetical protein